MQQFYLSRSLLGKQISFMKNFYLDKLRKQAHHFLDELDLSPISIKINVFFN